MLKEIVIVRDREQCLQGLILSFLDTVLLDSRILLFIRHSSKQR
jgi:hypothetical protein